MNKTSPSPSCFPLTMRISHSPVQSFSDIYTKRTRTIVGIPERAHKAAILGLCRVYASLRAVAFARGKMGRGAFYPCGFRRSAMTASTGAMPTSMIGLGPPLFVWAVEDLNL